MKAKQTTTPRKSLTANPKVPPARAVMNSPVEPVLFEYHDGEAREVSIAGSFNEWRPSGLDMIAMGGGKWAKTLLLPPGTYEYRLVVDGKWMPDPAAAKMVPNPFGEANSFLVVEGGRASSHAAEPRET